MDECLDYRSYSPRDNHMAKFREGALDKDYEPGIQADLPVLESLT
jgi:hypothetical protein